MKRVPKDMRIRVALIALWAVIITVLFILDIVGLSTFTEVLPQRTLVWTCLIIFSMLFNMVFVIYTTVTMVTVIEDRDVVREVKALIDSKKPSVEPMTRTFTQGVR